MQIKKHKQHFCIDSQNKVINNNRIQKTTTGGITNNENYITLKKKENNCKQIMFLRLFCSQTMYN